MEIIGISGYARSGKDAAANILVEKYGFQRAAFADILRDALLALNPIIGISYLPDYHEYSVTRVGDVINRYGWNGYKETPFGDEIRGNLQRLGTEVGRNILGENIWVDSLFASFSEDAKVVIADMRFPNEFDAVSNRGGKTWRVTRPGVGPANNHSSEISLDNHDFDVYINNNGSLEDYRKEIMKSYERIC